jgi:hypothetical protein
MSKFNAYAKVWNFDFGVSSNKASEAQIPSLDKRKRQNQRL